MPRTFDVVIVEDEPNILRNVIEKVSFFCPRLQVVGNALNGKEAIPIIENCHPHILITDIRMPQLDGLGLIRWARDHCPWTKVVILTGHEDFENARQAVQLNVTDFLLKPISGPELQTSLDKVILALDQECRTAERLQVETGVTGKVSDSNSHGARVPNGFDSHASFLILLVCVGNLCSKSVTSGLRETWHDRWLSLGPDAWTSYGPGTIECWDIDEADPNQKLLVVKASEREPLGFARALQERLASALGSGSVTIGYSPVPIALPNLGNAAQDLRNALRRRLIPFRSEIFSVTNPISVPELTTPLQNGIALAAIQAGNREGFLQELRSFLKCAAEQGLPQRQLERSILDLWASFTSHAILGPTSDRNFGERELNLLVFSSPNWQDFDRSVVEIFDALFHQAERSGQNAAALVREIHDHIVHNYAQDISFDALARRFSVSPAYLTKAFKKHLGETPTKCLTTIRLNEACSLLKSHPEVEIQDVAALVGYQDQHYFSRVFRAVVGKSPSDYRRSIKQAAE